MIDFTAPDIQVAVTLGGIFVLASTFPEAIYVLRTRRTRDVNLLFTVFAIIGIASYVYYAVRTEQWIFAAADSVDLTLWTIILRIKINNIKKGREGEPNKYKSEYCHKNSHIYFGKFDRCLICEEEK